jgi:hypothetical protein
MGRPPLGERAMTAAEKMRRYRERKFAPKPTAAEPPTAATKPTADRESAALKARIRELEAENAALKAELADSVGDRFASRRHGVKPKAARPPLPPDEERDRQIKSLKTMVQNLRAKNAEMIRWHDAEMRRHGKMQRATFVAVTKALHPDERHKLTAKQIDEACGLFTQWKKDQDHK